MREINIKDFWSVFVRRWWLMALAAVVCAGGLFAFDHLTYVPTYSSTATLYILHQNDDEAKQQTDSNFSLALKVVNDCDYLLKSRPVVDEVIDILSLDQSYSELKNGISTANPTDTRVLEVTVTADSPENAKRIVDVLCEIGQGKIAEAMGYQQVNLYEYGTLNATPSNGIGMKKYLLAGIVAAAVVYAAFLVVFLLDDRLHTREEIESRLGLAVLGEIANGQKGRYGYYAAHGQQTTKKRKNA